MKVLKSLSAIVLSLILMTGCGGASSDITAVSEQDVYATLDVQVTQPYTKATLPDTSSDEVDIDLTKMDSNMIYAQVANMVNNGNDYLGKKVRVTGPFSYFQENDGREFFAVLVSDATACCSQGIEFVLDGDKKYPDDYPEIGTTITVTGDFNYYKEDNYYTYIQLLHADMEVDNSLSW